MHMQNHYQLSPIQQAIALVSTTGNQGASGYNDNEIKNLHILVDTEKGRVSTDLQSFMMQEAFQISIWGAFSPAMSYTVVQQLLFLQSQNPEKEIKMVIHSPGGAVDDGLAIYDTMKFIANPICTFAIGQASSMGAFLLAAGDKGRRYALENASIMIHQPLGGFQGQATDMNIRNDVMQKVKKKLNKYLAEFTGQSIENVTKDTERDNFMTAQEALDYGLIDKVISNSSDIVNLT